MYRLVYHYAKGLPQIDIEGTYPFLTTARHAAKASLACFTRALNRGSITADDMPRIEIVNEYGDTVSTITD